MGIPSLGALKMRLTGRNSSSSKVKLTHGVTNMMLRTWGNCDLQCNFGDFGDGPCTEMNSTIYIFSPKKGTGLHCSKMQIKLVHSKGPQRQFAMYKLQQQDINQEEAKTHQQYPQGPSPSRNPREPSPSASWVMPSSLHQQNFTRIYRFENSQECQMDKEAS